jgi:hypothetical protein
VSDPLSRSAITNRNLSASLREIMKGLGITDGIRIYGGLRYYNFLYNPKALRKIKENNLTQSSIRTQSEAGKLRMEWVSHRDHRGHGELWVCLRYWVRLKVVCQCEK